MSDHTEANVFFEELGPGYGLLRRPDFFQLEVEGYEATEPFLGEYHLEAIAAVVERDQELREDWKRENGDEPYTGPLVSLRPTWVGDPRMAADFCGNCGGERWVCEEHPTLAWPTVCECGAGMPCPACHPYAPLNVQLQHQVLLLETRVATLQNLLQRSVDGELELVEGQALVEAVFPDGDSELLRIRYAEYFEAKEADRGE